MASTANVGHDSSTLVVPKCIDQTSYRIDEIAHHRNFASDNIQRGRMLDAWFGQDVEFKIAKDVLVSSCDRNG